MNSPDKKYIIVIEKMGPIKSLGGDGGLGSDKTFFSLFHMHFHFFFFCMHSKYHILNLNLKMDVI